MKKKLSIIVGVIVTLVTIYFYSIYSGEKIILEHHECRMEPYEINMDYQVSMIVDYCGDDMSGLTQLEKDQCIEEARNSKEWKAHNDNFPEELTRAQSECDRINEKKITFIHKLSYYIYELY